MQNNGQHRGNASELIALSAFALKGIPVAVPFGNQAGFDFLFLEGGLWKRAQVKTAFGSFSGRAYVQVSRGIGRNHRKWKLYTSGETDFIIAVVPETVTVWKLPVDVITKSLTRLNGMDDYLFQEGGVPRGFWSGTKESLPVLNRAALEGRERCRIKTLLHALGINESTQRPETANPDSWEMLQLHLKGYSLTAVGERYGIRGDSAADRIKTAAKKLMNPEQREWYEARFTRPIALNATLPGGMVQ